MAMNLGIDFGSSSTKIAVLHNNHVSAALTINKHDSQETIIAIKNLVKRLKIKKVFATGAYSNGFKMKEIEVIRVNEIEAIGKGGLFLSKEKDGLVVNVGSGTAIVSCKGKKFKHVAGTAIGARTVEGLGKLAMKESDSEKICKMAKKGRIGKVDLLIKDVYPKGIGFLDSKSSVSHFGNLKGYNKYDVSLGLLNMSGQAIGTIAALASRAEGQKRIILTGGLANSKIFTDIVRKRIGLLSKNKVIVARLSSYAAAIGACID